MEIVAEVTAFEMYRLKCLQGRPGTYKVTEDDGEINYCTLGSYGGEKWYSEKEYLELLERHDDASERLFESNMQFMDEHWDIGDVDPSHYNDCNGCGHCHLCDDHLEVAHDFTARRSMDIDVHPDCELVEAHAYLDNLPPSEGKTIGQLLREFNNGKQS